MHYSRAIQYKHKKLVHEKGAAMAPVAVSAMYASSSSSAILCSSCLCATCSGSMLCLDCTVGYYNQL